MGLLADSQWAYDATQPVLTGVVAGYIVQNVNGSIVHDSMFVAISLVVGMLTVGIVRIAFKPEDQLR